MKPWHLVFAILPWVVGAIPAPFYVAEPHEVASRNWFNFINPVVDRAATTFAAGLNPPQNVVCTVGWMAAHLIVDGEEVPVETAHTFPIVDAHQPMMMMVEELPRDITTTTTTTGGYGDYNGHYQLSPAEWPQEINCVGFMESDTLFLCHYNLDPHFILREQLLQPNTIVIDDSIADDFNCRQYN
ncbi:hypothetical protein BJ085DRAFT_35985 [Dimargaris cristalligena]|uniref:Uncharacterized protein n=1 Tax=Dimargaris cristalligena TaxID=215637 RepID=A0A4P9ZYS9_9FUNG|nr:hypothetical protein BJ085DRAFT_35985 [Dimargaris cristalligena]|eukprot:RKP38231.1 hypothetical protein BJ085DRAFT_35985 [Dimargaris cristalligena]